eukprot:scpid65838/ scgid26381/ 
MPTLGRWSKQTIIVTVCTLAAVILWIVLSVDMRKGSMAGSLSASLSHAGGNYGHDKNIRFSANGQSVVSSSATNLLKESDLRIAKSTGAAATRAATRASDWDVYNWDTTYPKPVVPSDWTDLLNRHARIQIDMCSGKIPLSAVVLTCHQPCYAMGEGLNGFMATYLLAVVTGRAYFMNSPSHFPVETYFDLAKKEYLLRGEVGTINWHMNECPPLMKRFALAKSKGKDILPVPDSTSPIPAIISPVINAIQCQVLQELAINRSLPEVLRVGNVHDEGCALSFVNPYNRKHHLEEIGKTGHEPVYRSVFRRLFSFRQDTVNAVDKYLKENDVSLSRAVCFHVRTGAFLADKVAKFQPNLKMEEFASCAFAAEKRLPQGGKTGATPWILVSDKPDISKSLLDAAKALSPNRKHILIDTERAGIGPVHLLMESNEAGNSDDATRKRAAKRILFDLYLLSQCQSLVVGQSGFAAMAAMLGPDWSHKKAFAVGKRMRGSAPAAAYVNGPCRRFAPGV